MKTKGRTRQLVKRLDAKGMTVREIAGVLDLTTQAVYYHLNAEKAGMGRGPGNPRKQEGVGDGTDQQRGTQSA